jgi:hypothetical protein
LVKSLPAHILQPIDPSLQCLKVKSLLEHTRQPINHSLQHLKAERPRCHLAARCLQWIQTSRAIVLSRTLGPSHLCPTIFEVQHQHNLPDRIPSSVHSTVADHRLRHTSCHQSSRSTANNPTTQTRVSLTSTTRRLRLHLRSQAPYAPDHQPCRSPHRLVYHNIPAQSPLLRHEQAVQLPDPASPLHCNQPSNVAKHLNPFPTVP